MNILFVNSNLYGHINPTLGLVKALTMKGNEVSYYCSKEFSGQVEGLGASWICMGQKLIDFTKNYRPTDHHPFFMLMEYMLSYDEVMLSEIIDIVKVNSFDLIICDSYFGGEPFLKQMTNIPILCSHSSFAMGKTPVPERMLAYGFHPQLDNCYHIIERICDRYQIEKPSIESVFTSKGDLNIVYTSQQFNGDPLIHEPEYIFVGPSVERSLKNDEFDFSVICGRKLIYISLGSVNTDFLDFYKMCIDTFKDTEYYICMSVGSKCNVDDLGEIPQNFMVKNFLPQLEILAHADAFVTHSGFNSVNEALYYGVPMLALPLVNDQHMVAKRLATLQVGIIDNFKELSSGILKSKIEALVSDKIIKENCDYHSLEMRKIAGFDRLIEIIEKYAKMRKEWN